MTTVAMSVDLTLPVVLIARSLPLLQGLMEQLDQDVDACCTHYDEATNTAELEQQLSQFEQVGPQLVGLGKHHSG